jgi:hypothetical protein
MTIINVTNVADNAIIEAGGGGPKVFEILKMIRKTTNDQRPHFPAPVLAFVKT